MSSRFPGVECFWIEETGRARLRMRRFTFATRDDRPQGTPGYRDCASGTNIGCSAIVDTDRLIRPRFDETEHGKVLRLVPKRQWPPAREWPQACDSCGEELPKDAHRVLDQIMVYVRANGATLELRGWGDKHAAGALFDSWWHRPDGGPGTDGIYLVAVCPDGTHWHVDAQASGGGHWTRTGDPRNPPTLTVSPSIQTGTYHGFLTNGRFTDDLGS